MIKWRPIGRHFIICQPTAVTVLILVLILVLVLILILVLVLILVSVVHICFLLYIITEDPLT